MTDGYGARNGEMVMFYEQPIRGGFHLRSDTGWGFSHGKLGDQGWIDIWVDTSESVTCHTWHNKINYF